MIGAGIFAALGPAAEAAGPGLLLGLGLAAIVAFCNASSSAQLAAVYPESGGTYVYARERLGPFWGYLAGWGFVVGKTASLAAMGLTFGTYAAPDRVRRRAAVPPGRRSRTVLAMARDHELPSALDAVHPRHRSPYRAELAVASVVILVVLLSMCGTRSASARSPSSSTTASRMRPRGPSRRNNAGGRELCKRLARWAVSDLRSRSRGPPSSRVELSCWPGRRSGASAMCGPLAQRIRTPTASRRDSVGARASRRRRPCSPATSRRHYSDSVGCSSGNSLGHDSIVSA
jgi:amino acid permease-like protein